MGRQSHGTSGFDGSLKLGWLDVIGRYLSQYLQRSADGRALGRSTEGTVVSEQLRRTVEACSAWPPSVPLISLLAGLGSGREVVALRKNGELLPVRVQVTDVTVGAGERYLCGVISNNVDQASVRSACEERMDRICGLLGTSNDAVTAVRHRYRWAVRWDLTSRRCSFCGSPTVVKFSGATRQ